MTTLYDIKVGDYVRRFWRNWCCELRHAKYKVRRTTKTRIQIDTERGFVVGIYHKKTGRRIGGDTGNDWIEVATTDINRESK